MPATPVSTVTTRASTLAFLVVALTGMLQACGGGSGGNDAPPPPPAPTGLSYAAPPDFVRGQPIAALTPTVTGSVSSYSISPQLPGGLALNTSSGVIAGTPDAVTPAANYTITANNSGGSTTTTVRIAVNDVPPVAKSGSFIFTTEVAASATLDSSGGDVVSWSIDPALPPGLALDAATGAISGTPTEASPSTQYQVTAQNSGGSSTTDVTIEVESGVLMDLVLGHPIYDIRASGNRTLVGDWDSHWTLWNSDTLQVVWRGSGRSAVFFAADRFLLSISQVEFELHSSADGHLITRFSIPPYEPFGAWWGAPADSTYFATGGFGGFKVWSPDGRLLLESDESYSGNPNTYFLGPDEIRIGRNDSVKTISISDGSFSIAPYPADSTFVTWFEDGEGSITKDYVAELFNVYSKDRVLENTIPDPSSDRNLSYGGRGDWYWFRDNTAIRFYRMGSGTAPVATYPPFANPGSVTRRSFFSLGERSLGISYPNEFRVIDLSGSTPVSTSYPAIPGGATDVVRKGDLLLVGDDRFYDLSSSGQRRNHTTGQVTIASGREHFAIQQISGEIQYFNAGTRELEGTIQSTEHAGLTMSEDGKVLFVQTNAYPYRSTDSTLDRTVKVYSLPSGAEIASFPYSSVSPGGYPIGIEASSDGQVVSFARWKSGNPDNLQTNREVFRLADGQPIWSDTLPHEAQKASVRLSPDGTLIAASTDYKAGASTVDIFKDGTLVATVPGWPAGWIDNERLLVNSYYSGEYEGAKVYDASGRELAKFAAHSTLEPTMPDLDGFVRVSADAVYDSTQNGIVSVNSGKVVWQRPFLSYLGSMKNGDRRLAKPVIAGPYVIYPLDDVLRIERHFQ